ncbi:hypothetical protein BpHYR1_050828 [Brachionus plicatilis]|uniref:Uncharacterized protein n=1 Tax=Brachionus plicatilis TaxID=10195 RepID=A0A3M7P541_BRAPC|nr:hypothetical protein BpHYR1_050828 [Brachionus plicatilis]
MSLDTNAFTIFDNLIQKNVNFKRKSNLCKHHYQPNECHLDPSKHMIFIRYGTFNEDVKRK